MTVRKGFLLLLTGLLLLIMVSGCAEKSVKCASPEDSREHHYVVGMEDLEKGQFDAALSKFEGSIYCDEGYSPAHSGEAIANASIADKLKDQDFKKTKFFSAMKSLELADKLTKTHEDEFAYYTAKIRILTLIQGNDWLNKAESAYHSGRKLEINENNLNFYDGKEAIDYFMGIAYFKGLEFNKSADAFKAVLNAKRDSKWNQKANEAWKRLEKVVRATAGITIGDVGKKIALKDEISRGDLAALLIDELKLDSIFAGRIAIKSELKKMQAEFIPADIVNHRFKEEIVTILKWKVRGLEPIYDPTTKASLFMPDQPVKRDEMALILEDVLIKITGKEGLASSNLGNDRSPFPDIRPSSPFFNAVMNVTTRNIMEGDLSGEFRPSEPVTGAEALLAIRVLKQSN
jgi:outer membrane protein assembly factor BamD (BamD/ComL family)